MKKQLIALSLLSTALTAEGGQAACVKPPKAAWFDRSECLLEGFAVVKKRNSYGVADAQGKVVLPAQYNRIGGVYRIPNTDAVFHQGLTMVGKGGRYGVANSKGRMLTPLAYKNPFVLQKAFEHGVELAEKGRADYVLLNRDGREILNLPYENVQLDAESGVLAVRNQGRFGLVDFAGKTLVPVGTYDEIADFRDGLARVGVNRLYGFINRKGQEVVAPLYDAANDFAGGVTAVRQGNVWRLLDSKGRVVADDLLFHEIGPFEHGLAVVSAESGQEGVIDGSGRVVLPPQYDGVQTAFTSPDFLFVSEQGKYALFDRKGSQLTAFTFERVVGDNAAARTASLQQDGMVYTFDVLGRLLHQEKVRR